MSTRLSVTCCMTAVLLGAAGCERDKSELYETITVDRGANAPAISADGKTIAFGLLGTIWLVPIQGGEARQISGGSAWDDNPAWSADGRAIAYAHNDPQSSQIMLHNLETGSARPVWGRHRSELGPDYVVYRPGTKFLIGQMQFHPVTGDIIFVNYSEGMWSVPQWGGAPRKLFAGSGPAGNGLPYDASFCISNDGKWVTVERDTVNQFSHVYRGALDTIVDHRRFTRLTTTPNTRHVQVTCSPNDSVVAFIERKAGKEAIIVQPVRGGAPRRIELGAYTSRQLRLHPDGKTAVLVSDRQMARVDLTSGDIKPIPFRAVFRLPRQDPGNLVITNARLFDGKSGTVVDNATVEVKDGVIARITSESSAGRTQNGATVIDAKGGFLMPGLIDAHAHTHLSHAYRPSDGLHDGVTSVVDLGSLLPQTLNIRDAAALGLHESPYQYTMGEFLNGPGMYTHNGMISELADPEAAAAVVREHKRQGASGIKIYAFTTPDVAKAVIDQAHALNIPVVGDLRHTTWNQAADLGIDGLIHLDNYRWDFVPPGQNVDSVFRKKTDRKPDSAEADAYFARLASKHVMIDPTFRVVTREDSVSAYLSGLTSKDTARANKDRLLTMVLRAADRAGIGFVAGTDGSGVDLKYELELYEAAGISRAKILQSATANVAKLYRLSEVGIIEPGRRADMILIDGNPLERISDLRRVTTVIQRGRMIR
jgi:hypothetical protein